MCSQQFYEKKFDYLFICGKRVQWFDLPLYISLHLVRLNIFPALIFFSSVSPKEFTAIQTWFLFILMAKQRRKYGSHVFKEGNLLRATKSLCFLPQFFFVRFNNKNELLPCSNHVMQQFHQYYATTFKYLQEFLRLQTLTTYISSLYGRVLHILLDTLITECANTKNSIYNYRFIRCDIEFSRK